jgi:DNA-binding CsgD family transcriptional regulator
MGEGAEGKGLGCEALTPRERACLRLVAQHHRSKEIARLLNSSKSTVDKHIDRARERLGASDRRAAALALIAWEAGMGIEYPSDPIAISATGQSGSTDRQFETAITASRNDQPQPRKRPPSDGPAAGDAGLSDELGCAGSGAQPALQPGQGRPDPDGDFGPAPVAAFGPAGKAAGPDPQRNGLADGGRSSAGWRAWRGGVDDLTPLRLMALIAGTAILGSLLLGGVLMGAQEVALLIQQIIDGIIPRSG